MGRHTSQECPWQCARIQALRKNMCFIPHAQALASQVLQLARSATEALGAPAPGLCLHLASMLCAHSSSSGVMEADASEAVACLEQAYELVALVKTAAEAAVAAAGAAGSTNEERAVDALAAAQQQGEAAQQLEAKVCASWVPILLDRSTACITHQ